MGVAEVAFAVDQVFCWPRAVGKGLPEFVVAVDDYGISQAKLFNAALHVALIAGKEKLRRVYADDDQALIFVASMPFFDVRQRAYAIHAGVVPEIDQHRSPSQLSHGKRW